jgi:uncharacterized DUF497 family protein
MSMLFTWDEQKALANERKHGVDFFEAQTVFGDPNSFTLFDEQHSSMEDRFVNLGLSNKGRLLIVVYTERESSIRLISCREATPEERRHYEQRAY